MKEYAVRFADGTIETCGQNGDMALRVVNRLSLETGEPENPGAIVLSRAISPWRVVPC
jgi:hypothetical protein